MQIKTQTLLSNVSRSNPGITNLDKASHFADALKLKEVVEAYAGGLADIDDTGRDLHKGKGLVVVDRLPMGQYGGTCKGLGKFVYDDQDGTPTCESMQVVEEKGDIRVGRQLSKEDSKTSYITKYFGIKSPKGYSMEVVHDQANDTISLLRHDEVSNS